MGTTQNFQIPYPETGDIPDGATQMRLLAQAVDTVIAAQVAALTAAITAITPLSAVKTEDLKRANVTALADDPDLSVVVAANTRYQFISILDYEGAAANSGDLKFAWTGPSGGVLYMPLYKDLTNSVVTGIAGNINEPFTAETAGAGDSRALMCAGLVYSGATAGSLTLQWAQNTANATTPTILHANSYMALIKVPGQ